MRLQLDTSLAGTAGASGTAATTGAGAQGLSSRNNADNQPGAAGDSAVVSGPATLLSSMSADRAVRIGQLSAAIQAGSYDVPSASVSRAMVAEALL